MNAFELGKSIARGIKKIRFLPATNNYEALIDLPAILFEEYGTRDSNAMIERGEVLKMPNDIVSKYLYQGDVRADKPPTEETQCKLFRSAGLDGSLIWVGDEFCMRGFLRRYPDANGDLYEVTAERVDDKTPPPNSGAWEKKI